MFSLDQAKVKLNSLNTRAEKHGPDRVPAYDLKFSAKVPSTELIEFHSTLRSFLFVREEVDGEGDNELNRLRFPDMGAVAWEWEGIGYTLTLQYGLGDVSTLPLDLGVQNGSNVVAEDCKVNNFLFTPQDGGTVEIAFRIQCHLKSADVGKFCEYIQRDAIITLAPPNMEEKLAA